MRPGQLVLVHLVGPREKFWGVLVETSPAGVTVRGLGLDLFDSWMREVAKGRAHSSHPATVFFPLHRVERIFADESAGDVESYAERFIGVVGADVRDYLK
ncbi:MAG TPA: hypothetical protein VKS03_03085 [Thermoanaerobaculia bacterium]|nr:hypothetical protein [Thermoanaerobaculia bacterium]